MTPLPQWVDPTQLSLSWVRSLSRVTGALVERFIGTSSIVHEKTHQPLLSTLSRVVETVVNLKAQGHKVVLVSSGAIGVGLKRMEMASRPKSLSGKQACPLELPQVQSHRNRRP